MKYEITFSEPLSHLLNIKLTIENVNSDELKVYIPFWRPGRYEAANYSKNIRGVVFEDENGNPLKWQKTNANQWVVACEGAKEVIVNYQYFAFTMDAGNSWYDDELIYINFINCLFFVQERLNEPCELNIDLPSDYKVGSALKTKGAQSFSAGSYYEIVDSPLLASKDLEQITYQVYDVNFFIWIKGEHKLDQDKLKNQFEAFSKSQIETLGGFPENEYHFLLIFPPYKHYHGVEHGASTVVVIGPGSDLSKNELYKELLGVSSHELFHAWNIIKIRPAELAPYDFTNPIVFSTGYVAEGFTTYYGDLFLSRSGVFDKKAYFNELNTLLNRHFWNYGRYNESVITSSLNLWVDGYSAGAPNKKSSIYVEGAMVALMLDLTIRSNTDSKKSLDDVMRTLWEKFGKSDKGYSHAEIKQSCEAIAEMNLDDFFINYVDGTADKYDSINTLLATVGCKLEQTENENLLSRHLGIRTVQENDGMLKIVQIAPESIGERYFSINDKIKDNIATSLKEDVEKLEIEVERNYRTIDLKIELNEETYFKNHSIAQLNNATEKQKEVFKNWSGQTF